MSRRQSQGGGGGASSATTPPTQAQVNFVRNLTDTPAGLLHPIPPIHLRKIRKVLASGHYRSDPIIKDLRLVTFHLAGPRQASMLMNKDLSTRQGERDMKRFLAQYAQDDAMNMLGQVQNITILFPSGDEDELDLDRFHVVPIKFFHTPDMSVFFTFHGIQTRDGSQDILRQLRQLPNPKRPSDIEHISDYTINNQLLRTRKGPGPQLPSRPAQQATRQQAMQQQQQDQRMTPMMQWLSVSDPLPASGRTRALTRQDHQAIRALLALKKSQPPQLPGV